jgi:hypothetical protein
VTGTGVARTGLGQTISSTLNTPNGYLAVFVHPYKRREGRGCPPIVHTLAGLGCFTTGSGSAAFGMVKLLQPLIPHTEHHQ